MKKLPRHYWPITVSMLLFVMATGVAFGVTVGINPYIAAFVAGGGFALRETYILKRKGY